MATDHHQAHSSHGDDGGRPLNHETTDISLEGIGKLTAGFVIVLLVVSAAMYGTYRLLDRRLTAADTSAPHIDAQAPPREASVPLMEKANEAGQAGRAAAGPALLTNEPRWLADIKARNLDVLSTYAWVDKQAGTVRLPIERAKQLIVERGLPQAAAPEGPTPDGAAPATDGPTAPAPGDHGAPAAAQAPGTPPAKAAAPPH